MLNEIKVSNAETIVNLTTSKGKTRFRIQIKYKSAILNHEEEKIAKGHGNAKI